MPPHPVINRPNFSAAVAGTTAAEKVIAEQNTEREIGAGAHQLAEQNGAEEQRAAAPPKPTAGKKTTTLFRA